jgi:hypothetical protein
MQNKEWQLITTVRRGCNVSLTMDAFSLFSVPVFNLFKDLKHCSYCAARNGLVFVLSTKRHEPMHVKEYWNKTTKLKTVKQINTAKVMKEWMRKCLYVSYCADSYNDCEGWLGKNVYPQPVTLSSRSSSKCYLRIQSVPQREHHTSPLHTSTG